MKYKDRYLERLVENRLREKCKDIGVIAYKFTSPNRRSVPDRLLIGPDGFHMFVELKATGAKPTKAQAREILRLKNKGHWVVVIDHYQGVDNLIDAIRTYRRILCY